MAMNAGVWIDHKQAIVVVVTDAGKEIKKIAFDIGQPIRSVRGSKSERPYKPKEYLAEDKLERKLENDRKDYYDDVIASVRGAEGLLVFGPGEAKGEFVKRLQSKKLRGVAVDVETAGKMTDRQIAAKVGGHFAAPVAKKIAAARKNVKKKIRSAASGKRRKNS